MSLDPSTSYKLRGVSASTLEVNVDSFPSERSPSLEGRAKGKGAVVEGIKSILICQTERVLAVKPSLVSCIEQFKHVRLNHPFWYEANHLLKNPRLGLWWFDDEVISKIRNLFLSYLDDVERKGIRLKKDGEEITIPYMTRVSADYVRAVRNRLWSLKDVRCGVQLELTTDMKRFNSYYECVKSLEKNWNRFITMVNLRRKRRGLDRLKYVKALEFGPEHGMTHLHVYFAGIKSLMSQKEISNWWLKYGQGEITYVQHKRTSMVGYVMKYITKTLRAETRRDVMWHQALLWAGGFRSFSVSKGLLARLPKKVKKGWNYVGSYYLKDRGVERGIDPAVKIRKIELLRGEGGLEGYRVIERFGIHKTVLEEHIWYKHTRGFECG